MDDRPAGDALGAVSAELLRVGGGLMLPLMFAAMLWCPGDHSH